MHENYAAWKKYQLCQRRHTAPQGRNKLELLAYAQVTVVVPISGAATWAQSRAYTVFRFSLVLAGGYTVRRVAASYAERQSWHAAWTGS